MVKILQSKENLRLLLFDHRSTFCTQCAQNYAGLRRSDSPYSQLPTVKNSPWESCYNVGPNRRGVHPPVPESSALLRRSSLSLLAPCRVRILSTRWTAAELGSTLMGVEWSVEDVE